MYFSNKTTFCLGLALILLLSCTDNSDINFPSKDEVRERYSSSSVEPSSSGSSSSSDLPLSSSSSEQGSSSSSSVDTNSSSSSLPPSSSSSEPSNGSSSSSVQSSSSIFGISSSSVELSSSSATIVSSSSSVGCEGYRYNSSTHFCYEEEVYEKCNSVEYTPTTQICQNGVASPAKCNNQGYNPLTQDCCNNSAIFSKSTQRCTNGGIVETKCGNEWYNSATRFCQSPGVVKDLCGIETYTAKQFCSNGNRIGDFCGNNTQTYDLDKYKCDANKTPNGIYLMGDINAVLIGEQIWMAENMNYDVPGDATDLCYDNDPNNCTTYGRLYNWATAMNLNSSCNTEYDVSCNMSSKHQGICPSGWHIPSIYDWNALMKFIIPGCDNHSSCAAGTKLKTASGWIISVSEVPDGTDDYGFSALPSGYALGEDIEFSLTQNVSCWWSSTTKDNYWYSQAYIWGVSGNSGIANRWEYSKLTSWCSVRCLKD